MSDELHTVIQSLLSCDDTAWSNFLFNIPLARALLTTVDQSQAKNILAAGGSWEASSLTTSQVSRKLWDTAKVALVLSTQQREYLHLWLYALSLAWQLDVGELHLGDRAGEAAFYLMELITGAAEGHAETDDEEEEPPEAMRLDWEEQEAELSRDLVYLWNKARLGDRLDLKNILQQVPQLKELPSKAPDNNHRPTSADKNLKVVQQSILHGLRLFAHSYQLQQERAEEGKAQATFQQGWKQVADLYWKVEELRKELSIPGSTAGHSDQLFNKQDLGNALLNSKIKTYRSGKGYVPPYPDKSHSFRPSSSTGFKTFGKKGKKGFGFGSGSG